MSVQTPQPETIDQWFGLSRAHYAVLPRLALQEMPVEWQQRFTALVDEMNDRFQVSSSYTILYHDEQGRIARDPWGDYRRGSAQALTDAARSA